MEAARQYLENFWKHKVGNVVRDSENQTHRITNLVAGYPEQIVFEDGDSVHYIQDFTWEPTQTDLDEILSLMGIAVSEATVRYRTSFLPRPRTPEEYVNVIRTFRNLGLLHGQDPLEREGMLN